MRSLGQQRWVQALTCLSEATAWLTLGRTEDAETEIKLLIASGIE